MISADRTQAQFIRDTKRWIGRFSTAFHAGHRIAKRHFKYIILTYAWRSLSLCIRSCNVTYSLRSECLDLFSVYTLLFSSLYQCDSRFTLVDGILGECPAYAPSRKYTKICRTVGATIRCIYGNRELSDPSIVCLSEAIYI